MREAVDLLAVGSLEGQLARRIEELVVGPVAVRRRRDTALLEEIEIDVLEPRHDPQRIRHDLALVGRRGDSARVEVGLLRRGQRWLGELARGRVLEHVTAGGVEDVRTSLLLEDRNVELLVRLRTERA